MDTAFTAKATYGQVFAITQFRAIFAGRLLGIGSDTLRSVALAVLVFDQTRSPLLAALAITIGFLPQAAGGLFLAAMADRFAPRTLIAAGYAFQCAVGLVLAFAHLPVAVSLLLVAAVACLTPITSGAAARVLADVLTGDAYVLGRSLSYLVAVGAQMAGMAAGGALVAWLGVEWTMFVTAVAHLLAAVICYRYLARTEAVRADGPAGSIVRKTLRGNAELVAAPGVAKLILAQCLPAAYLAAAGSLLIPYAARRAFDPAETSVLLATTSAGMLVGDIVIGRAFPPATRERLVLPLLLVMGAPPIAILLNPPHAVVVAAYAITGFGSAYLLGLQRRYLEAVPADLQGQGFALLNTATMTIQGVGPLVFGGFAEFLPIEVAIALTGVSSVLTTWFLRGAIRSRTA
ncbi:MFS transporter [Actinokineospora auranticolor]|uniref:MFS transporter n=1 Tax=Actinokineospora auranticolor TaxID=155976 RepID=A0A2S6GE28_9PSEU|nr:MFS transporter [Actinokineospora auranticolor]PPK63484.1 MFS transporter [Actinokineospora auranticolor]